MHGSLNGYTRLTPTQNSEHELAQQLHARNGWWPLTVGSVECGSQHEFDVTYAGSFPSWLLPSETFAAPQSVAIIDPRLKGELTPAS